ncbi:hypothetical protein LEP1GSC151_2814 [Leptospira interrogans serovar Grippotyphosa str. LT2186]|uniref:Cyanophage baseplate Pam3 plug gp18 domain-containing protein n=1 Tax=Leptospira interrogans serovar Grippotyphosa str. LT2186 TaxID=1001599 RepID=M3FXB2_LEPIR|nr:hypothetical protein [Leptospira interrogans]EKR46036.1 hypothetical protein LEP1GSC097_0926 [Leptospira interrogans serovar Grippotyphosa str. UI 08368]EMG12139.1 hypothetical protein LEP1GSC151_2814 [Leptospira interrogans serovar Grippotyphosa str. LT2186]EMN83622.1 hypothetical protein LEP1GSC107_1276 [Leptospira interrogans serovar Grippotyphosa str. UI 12769]
MLSLKYLPFSSETFPVRYEYEIDGKDFEFEFNYNSVGDFITVLVRDSEGKILFSTKLVYGVPLNHFVVDGFPNDVKLIPLNLDDLYRDEFVEISVNRDTLGSTVQIYIIEKTT